MHKQGTSTGVVVLPHHDYVLEKSNMTSEGALTHHHGLPYKPDIPAGLGSPPKEGTLTQFCGSAIVLHEVLCNETNPPRQWPPSSPPVGVHLNEMKYDKMDELIETKNRLSKIEG